MSACCVSGCKNRHSATSKLKFYRIPSGYRPFQANRRRLWLRAIQQVNGSTEGLRGNARICGAHFVSGVASMDHDSPDFVPSVFTCTKTSPKKKPKRFCGRRRRRRHKLNVVKEEIKTPPQVDSPVDLQSSVLMKSESELPEETQTPSTPSKETVTKEAEAETGIGTIKSQTIFRPNKTLQSFKVPAGLPGLDKMSPVVLLKPLVIPAGEYQYELCNQDFKSVSEPVKHKQLHEEESSFICEICGKHFTSETVFTEHQCDLKDEPSFPCNMCDRSFTSSHNLKRHKLLHVKDGRKCSICGVLFCRRHNHVLFLPKTEPVTESEEDASVDDEQDASVDELQNVKSEQSQTNDLGDAAQSTGTATSTTTLSTPQKSVLSSRTRKLPPLRPKPPSMLHSPPPVPRYSENPGTSSMPPLPGYPAIFIEPIDLPPPELPPSLKLFSPQYLTSALLEVKRNYEYILSKPCNVKKVIVKEEEYEVPLVSPDEQNVEQVKKERTAYDLEIVV
ncbi:protein-serine O-palmitoleoyltransferase porcupine isoform X1 [Lates japonicus]